MFCISLRRTLLYKLRARILEEGLGSNVFRGLEMFFTNMYNRHVLIKHNRRAIAWMKTTIHIAEYTFLLDFFFLFDVINVAKVAICQRKTIV